MQIDIITVVPGLLEGPFSHSILKRAAEKNLLQVNIINLRTYTTYARAQVDDYPFGGGAGMVLRADVLGPALDHGVEHADLVGEMPVDRPARDASLFGDGVQRGLRAL